MNKAKLKRSVVAWLALAPLVVVTIFPLAVLLSSSLKSGQEVLSYPPRWIPEQLRFDNFLGMWEAVGFGQALSNSLIVCSATVLFTLLLAVPLAYALSRGRFRGIQAVQSFLLLTQVIPPMVLVLGLFQLVVFMGWVNTLSSLVFIYTGFFLAFAAWMLRSYIDSIPFELEEAALLEGATRVRLLWEIVFPLALPAIAVAAIFTFINAWNEFVLALTMLRSEEKYTLTIQIFAQVGGRYVIEWHYVMAATAVAVVPVAVVFALMQRYMVHGLTAGAVK